MKLSIVELPKRNKTKYIDKAGIIHNGIDNLYPQRMERLIQSSVTAVTSTGILGRFLKGEGFTIPDTLKKTIVGRTEIFKLTPNKLLKRIANNVSTQRGVFLHVNWNANFQIDTVSVIPFAHCRLCKVDSNGIISQIAVYDNWDKEKGKFDKEKIRKFDVFNTNKKAIEAQVKAAGGFEQWTGQVYYYNFDDSGYYPLSIIDSVQDDCDTESQISIFKNGELRQGFFTKYLVRHAYFADDDEKEDFLKDLAEFGGAENQTPFMVVEDEMNEDDSLDKTNTLKLEKIEQNINARMFDHYEVTTANNIRKACNNIPPLLIDYNESKLGSTSGEAITQAKDFLNEQTKDDRNTIEEICKEIFSFYKVKELQNPEYWNIIELSTKKKLDDSNI